MENEKWTLFVRIASALSDCFLRGGATARSSWCLESSQDATVPCKSRKRESAKARNTRKDGGRRKTGGKIIHRFRRRPQTNGIRGDSSSSANICAICGSLRFVVASATLQDLGASALVRYGGCATPPSFTGVYAALWAGCDSVKCTALARASWPSLAESNWMAAARLATISSKCLAPARAVRLRLSWSSSCWT